MVYVVKTMRGNQRNPSNSRNASLLQITSGYRTAILLHTSGSDLAKFFSHTPIDLVV